jgi:hypothetical protein
VGTLNGIAMALADLFLCKASLTGLDIEDDLANLDACRASALHVQYQVSL